MKCDPSSLQQQLGEEGSTHPPAYQDSWFRRDVFTAWDKQSKRMWEVLVKENKPIHFMFGNCICWNFIQNELSNLTKNCYMRQGSNVSKKKILCRIYSFVKCQMVKGQLLNVYKKLAGILLVLLSLGVVASWAVLFLPAERWTITWTTAGRQGERGAWGSGRSSSSSSSVHQLHSPQSERMLGDLPQWHAFPGYCPL